MTTVAIVDYGMGNVGSVANAFFRLGATAVVTAEPRELARADGIVLPGVGAFGAAMANLNKRDLIEPLNDLVRDARRPFLGICLGLQLIADDSEEYGHAFGLGWIPGQVRLMRPESVPVPHVGWNDVRVSGDTALFQGLEARTQFYFDHSYALDCDDAVVTGRCDYGATWVAAVQRENIHAVQFHPEKSQRSGLRLLRNFLRLAGRE